MTQADHRRVARLFGQLLLRELDAPMLAGLSEPEVAAALEELGIKLPAEDELEASAAAYFAQILQPSTYSPLVHSLWREGSYQGEPAVAVRRVAEAAGLSLAADARGAPVDHLGCLLMLWAELADSDPELAADFARAQLAWVPSAAARIPAEGFYGSLIRATAALCAELSGTAAPR